MLTNLRFPLVALLVSVCACVARAESDVLDLRGSWAFQIAGAEPSFPQANAPAQKTFSDSIELPGTTETRGKGPENPATEVMMLTRVRKFDGPAWYQRDVEIPAEWAGKRIELLLERTKYVQVWFDGQPRGEQRWASVPQRYILTDSAVAGKHVLTIVVDNRAERRPYEAEAHQYSDNTQTNWNGLLGRLELRAIGQVQAGKIQVYPEFEKRAFRLEIPFDNRGTAATAVQLKVEAESWNHEGSPHRPGIVNTTVQAGPGRSTATVVYPIGNDARTWDEFSPALYRLTVSLEIAGEKPERAEINAGFRELRRGKQILVNGRATFLRGKHDGCVWPLTGHPPLDVGGWVEYFTKLRTYGINHVRCHTWVPPEAAFAAADRVGIYLQPELAFWGTYNEKIRDALTPEAELVVQEYGNHPSFAMMTLGNEMGGDRTMMNALVQHLREIDPRHLYADGSNNVLWDPDYQPTNDFFATARAKTPATGSKSVPARGSYYFGDGYDGPVQWGPPGTRGDLRAANEGIPAAVIGHEIGQYTVYPNFREITKYTGVVAARNLMHFRESLRSHGMLDQAEAWFRASGALAASLYKEEIELALRTPEWGGIQLLDLQDFPGQGTALVGILDAFLDSKGLITPEEWRRFCSAIVPLARFDRYTWTAGENYSADVELAHYGPQDLRQARATWRLVSPVGEVVAEGSFAPTSFARGGLRSVGHLETALPKVTDAKRYDLEVVVANASQRYVNAWPLWVYPKLDDGVARPTPAVVRSWAAAKEKLRAGGAVLLIPEGQSLGYTVRGAYATDFWCWPMFSSAPGTMGLLIDANHPALKGFPTSTHSERQWSNIAHASTPVILTEGTAELRPVVQVIDNLARNEKLGLVFEAKVGAGRLLVSAVDLYSIADKPEVKQLLYGLTEYVASDHFAPRVTVAESALDIALTPSLAEKRPVSASSFHQPPWGAVPKPEAAVDGDINTRWTAKEGDAQAHLAVDLGQAAAVRTVQILWELDQAGYKYVVEGSADGTSWSVMSDQRENAFPAARHTLAIPSGAAPVRHVRVTVQATPNGKPASIRDLRVL
jgi:hypothetical protein